MSETENPKCHSLSKNEGLSNGGNNVSSNVSDEMTEVCYSSMYRKMCNLNK